MALKNVIAALVVAASAQAFASSRVEDRVLSLNEVTRKTHKSKPDPKAKVYDSLNTSETQKTELPKNARHDATAGVFI